MLSLFEYLCMRQCYRFWNWKNEYYGIVWLQVLEPGKWSQVLDWEPVKWLQVQLIWNLENGYRCSWKLNIFFLLTNRF